MKVELGKQQKETVISNPGRGRVVISMNPVKERVRLDIDGNEIDPKTKKIIRLAKDVI